MEAAVTTEVDVLDRLATCWAEVAGVAAAFKLEPSMPIDGGQLPAVYCTSVGGVSQPTHFNTDEVKVVRGFVWRLLGMPLETGLDDENEGAEALRVCVPFLMRAHKYFAEHPGLTTTAGARPLAGVELAQMTDSGVVGRAGPGGAVYAAIDFTLTITVREQLGTVYI
jgi:hypothetical protein